MKIALCNEMYQNWSLANQFEAFAAWGYDGAELAPFSLDPDFVSGASPLADISRIDVARRREIVALSHKTGVQVSGLHWILAHTEGLHITMSDAATRQKTLRYLESLVKLCADLGGTYLVFGSPKQRGVASGQSYQEAEKNALEVIAALLPTLDANGVTLALEALAPTETNFWVNSEQTLDFIEKLGSPEHVRLHLDCKAMHGGEYQSLHNVIRRVGATHQCVSFHANDPNLQGPGFGLLDFQPIIAALQEIQFDGWIGIEPFDYSPGIVELGRESIRYLKKFLPSDR